MLQLLQRGHKGGSRWPVYTHGHTARAAAATTHATGKVTRALHCTCGGAASSVTAASGVT